MKRLLFVISLLIMSSMQLSFAQRQVIYSPEVETAADNGDAEAQYIMGCILTTMNVGIPLDENRGTEYLKKSDAAGCPMGTWQLGMSYHNGSGVTKDETKATELFKKSIPGLKKLSKTNPLASELLGESYEGGYGVSPKIKTGIEYFTKAAENGNAFAMRELSLLYYSGEEIEADNALAKGWLLKAVNAGDPVAMYWMAGFYERGDGGFDKNDQLAKDMYLKAAKAGVPEAMNRVGVIYDDEEKYEEANTWYELAIPFRNAAAMYNLGVNYEGGYGKEQNVELANECYKKSASLGNDDAMCALGINFMEGIGVQKNTSVGKEWLQKAINEKNSHAAYYMGKILQEGVNVEQNFESAVAFYKYASSLNNADAYYALGMMYKDGIYFRASGTKAKECFEQAIKYGNKDAYYQLGYMCQVMGKYSEANEYMTKAARTGNLEAMNVLGLNYYNGNGIPMMNLTQAFEYQKIAFEYFKDAAEGGVADAMINLGHCYESSTATPKDLSKAKEWYLKAKEAGHPQADTCLENLEKLMQ